MSKKSTAWLPVLILVVAGIVMAGLAWNSAVNPRIIIEWSTASELEAAGFNLYRTDEQNPDPIRLNESLIPPSSDPLQGGSYKYTDSQVEAGKTYQYTLEEVEFSGNLINHGTTEASAPQGGLLEGITAVILWVAAAAISLRERKKAA
jgi:hypothetical protein